MQIKPEDFRARQGAAIDLGEWPTEVSSAYESKSHYKKLLRAHVERLSELQQLLYAANRYAVLLIFQAMDAAGKDGVIRHVMSGVNPQGCQVFSYKHPSAAELQHDFLWRTTRDLPERGRIGIFNRSYYEEVLITRVHPEILRGEGLPGTDANDEKIWSRRFRSIVGLERHLSANGTRVIKFYLHMSKRVQAARFLDRIDDVAKHWKVNPADFEERGYWKKYMQAYAAAIAATSSDDAPWYVVPADDKKNARLIVSQIVVETLAALDMHYPVTSPARSQELQSLRAQLES